MIKRLNKIVAGITAAAALLLAAGCKNQLDYVDDTTARNAFNVAGLYVTGLDSSYNGAPVSLQVVTAIADDGDKTEESWFATEVAYSYKDNSGNVVGYQSGTAYKKEAKLYDGDALAVKTYAKNAKVFAASSIECYLKVGSDTFKVVSSDGTKLENAKLSVPTSPAGTKDKDLSSKWVTVTIKDGIATFALAGNADEPVNVTLPTIKLDILTKTADTLPAAIKIEKVAKTGTNQKFTLKLTGLKEHAGTEFILGGSDISLTDGSLGSYWYNEKFKSKISDDGEIGWTFYGSAVNSGNISDWGRTYSSEQAGPEILILKADDPKKENGMQLLASGVSRKGVKGDSENFMFPAYTIGNYDVTCTIDVAKLTKGTDYTQADPEAPKSTIRVAGIKVINAPLPTSGNMYFTAPDEYAGYEDAKWEIPENTYNENCHKYTSADLSSAGNYNWIFNDSESEPTYVEVIPYNSKFRVGIRLVDGEFWKGVIGNFVTPYYNTEDFAYDAEKNNKSYILVVQFDLTKKSAIANLVEKSIANMEDKESYNYTINFKLKNGIAGSTYFINGALFGWKTWPFKAWSGDKTSITDNPDYYVKLSDSETSKEFSIKYYGCSEAGKTVSIDEFQLVAVVPDGEEYTNGGIQIIDKNLSFVSSKNNETKTITIDVSGKTMSIE